MTHLGVYYAPEHRIPGDTDYITKLQPPVIRLLDPDVQQIADMHVLVPGAIICPRTWIIDDHDGAAVRNLMADPVATGIDHANQYRSQLDRWHKEASERGLTLPADDHICFNSANEPNQGGTPDKIAAYCVAFLDRCTELGLRACAPCLGVGWPDNTGKDTPVDWSAYAKAGLEQAIKRNGGFLDVHEYHYKDGPQNNWTWWAGRHLQCPFDVPILLSEIGIDNYVDQPRWAKDGGNRGWQGNVTPDQYAEMIEWHIRHSDTRVVAALPFVTDFRNREWESFNTRAAHGALLARKDAMTPQATPMSATPPAPAPTGPTTPLFVNVPAGARLRGAPTTNANALQAIPYGSQVNSFGTEMAQGAIWNHVIAPDGQQGWILGSLLSPTAPANPGPTPPVKPTEPAPAGDDWSRVWPVTLNIEGGLSTDRSDPGNYRPDGTFVGTKFGISALAHPTLDIVNLTKEQALDIYRRDYWQGSGADKLPWPLNLLMFDAYVQNEAAAKKFLAASGGDPDLYMAERIDWYTRAPSDDQWQHNSKGWMRRCATMLREASKP